MRNSSLIGRIAAVAAIVVAVVAVVLIVFQGGTNYTIKATFSNASQIVSGDLVEVAGNSIGTVSSISLTPDGQAQLTMDITNSMFDPLHQGTQATVRLASLSGIANRYIQLDLGPATAPKIPNDGSIAPQNATSAVDLDEVFDTLNPATLRGLQQVIQGSAKEYAGRGQQAQAAFAYLNPAIASTSQLFSEINRSTPRFTNFITRSGQLLSTIASRQSELSALVSHLATTTGALASQHVALGQSIQRLPGFMTLADTTFTNLRTALNDLTPLVNETKPVAPKLQSLLTTLKPLAENAVPTVDDLADIVSRPGADNDLTELTRLGKPLAEATVDQTKANGKLRPGAFKVSTQALNESTPELATDRPYVVDLTGWFEGFSHPGGQDANGNYSRVAPIVGIASINNGVLNILPAAVTAALRQALAFGSNGSGGAVVTGQADRCPGSMERGAIYYPESGYPCSPDQVPTGK